MSHKDYLPGTPFLIEQPEDMYHFNSDTELLGRFIKLSHKDAVLDAGCSTGALLMYASLQHPFSLTGIDLFPEVLLAAEKNLKENSIHASLICTRLQEYQGKADVILINPPYFPTKNDHLKNENQYLKAARHEEYLTLHEVFLHADRILNEQGKFFLVHRVVRLEEIMKEMQKTHMHASRMRFAYEKINGRAKTVLLEIRKGRCPQLVIEAPAFLNDRASY